MPEEPTSGRRDLVLSPQQMAYVQDTTNGHVSTYVGANKFTPSNTEQLVLYNPKTGGYDPVDTENAAQPWILATEEQYVVLHNPVKSGDEHPKAGSSVSDVPLNFGETVVIPGPANFALFPGQTAEVVDGHKLQLDEYLLVEVYNGNQARTNWDASVRKPQVPPETPPTPPAEAAQPVEDKATEEEGPKSDQQVTAEIIIPTTGILTVINPAELVTGMRFVIPGTECGIYIPPSGIRALKNEDSTGPDDRNKYIRKAVTLEWMEYCMLRAQNGQVRYVHGPAVVFPSPTEEFVEDSKKERVFKAFSLDPQCGVWVKVLADYTDETGQPVKAGTDLFRTGKTHPFYIPRAEHMVVGFGDQRVHNAVAIPKGEGRYVLDKLTGEVELVRGPQMLLPDPRYQSVVRRVLPPNLVQLLYPGNTEAMALNMAYSQQLQQQAAEDALSRGSAMGHLEVDELLERAGATLRSATFEPEPDYAGTQAKRRRTPTPSPAITLDTKYDGAVAVNVWNGYAIMVVDKMGNRRVVVGPATVLLAYDETVESFEVLTGTPKGSDGVKRDVYLRVKNNTVKDQIDAESKDLCRVRIRLALRVNFEGDDAEKWFAVENYVRLLTEHIRSLVRGAVKQYLMTEFYLNSTTILRDAILGVAQEGHGRPGRPFVENAMLVYDVEILDVVIEDKSVSQMFADAQREAFEAAIAVQRRERERDSALKALAIDDELAQANAKARLLKIKLADEQSQAANQAALADAERKRHEEEARLDITKVAQAIDDFVASAELARDKAEADQANEVEQQRVALVIEQLQAEAKAFVERANALAPEIVSALQRFSDADLSARAAEAMAPMALLGGKSVVDVLLQLLGNSPLADAVKRLAGSGGVPEQD